MAELSDLLVARKPSASSTDDAYANWRADPTPENMKAVLDDLDTTINSEIQRFSGPKPLLRSKARALAVKAVRSYDPAGGTRLRSWVVTQLQPLSRYNNSLKPIYAPEDVSRKAYAISKARETLLDETGREPTDEELADRVGISVKRLGKIRGAVPTIVNETMGEDDDDDSDEFEDDLDFDETADDDFDDFDDDDDEEDDEDEDYDDDDLDDDAPHRKKDK